MDFMSQYPDGFFDLAVCDPPYFSGPEKRGFYGRTKSTQGVQRIHYPIESQAWKVPGPEYFKELFRVSKQQIVWGVNYYSTYLGPGRIVWDKVNQGTSFSDCELAYCSLHDSVRLFRYMWNGMLQGRSIDNGHIQQADKSKNQKRIHPTEKPIHLYEWIFRTYAKPGQKILDTHLGSGSIVLAALNFGVMVYGSEISTPVFDRAIDRITKYGSTKLNQTSLNLTQLLP